jgi:hypothetical protein
MGKRKILGRSNGGLTAEPDHILCSRRREECVQCRDCGVERLRREVDRSVHSSALRDRLGQNMAPPEKLRFVHALQGLAYSTKVKRMGSMGLPRSPSAVDRQERNPFLAIVRPASKTEPSHE